MFGVAGLQRGLLGQLQRFHRRGWPAVGCLEIGGKDAPLGLDGGSTGRPAGVQSRVDADDFPYRPLPHVLVGTLGEPDTEAVTKVVL